MQSLIKTTEQLRQFSIKQGCQFFSKERKKSMHTRVLKAVLDEVGDKHFVIATEVIPYPKGKVFRLLSVDNNGKVEIEQSALTKNECIDFLNKIKNEESN